ncbi:MAG: hypothetical protein DLM62_20290 [Pseudonocardiales bacterium]|nr:MAG: hypothetical protein DLM62_20290 [Pseudonocardiales bacterium]
MKNNVLVIEVYEEEQFVVPFSVFPYTNCQVVPTRADGRPTPSDQGSLAADAAAQAAAARAHRLAQACDGARTPALAAAAAPLPLSNREREILMLATQGSSNSEIAQRLVISVRTVEGHRYRASTRLGTSDLAELAALLRGE